MTDRQAALLAAANLMANKYAFTTDKGFKEDVVLRVAEEVFLPWLVDGSPR